MYGERPATAILSDLLARMKELGGDHLEASYQGGNDEGGVEEISLFKGDGDARLELALDDQENDWRGSDTLFSLANELLSTKYYGWAWEGSAWGTLHVSLSERRAWEEGTETTEQAIEEPLGVNL